MPIWHYYDFNWIFWKITFVYELTAGEWRELSNLLYDPRDRLIAGARRCPKRFLSTRSPRSRRSAWRRNARRSKAMTTWWAVRSSRGASWRRRWTWRATSCDASGSGARAPPCCAASARCVRMPRALSWPSRVLDYWGEYVIYYTNQEFSNLPVVIFHCSFFFFFPVQKFSNTKLQIALSWCLAKPLWYW